MEDITETILLQLKQLSRDTPEFSVALLENRLSHDEQVSFADRLVDAAETIRQRALNASGQVVEGGVVDDDVSESKTIGTSIGES
ncbi:hypothetical protein [Amycolatopsis vastitatis]|uniref:Uncharacterized protein n=1 Tax=Amycolatopsis vastitatis TaxID=1905142 RepID=A0A229SMG2_9PSEU|nr:hypothetical protein [Amycolatopsis vastitatis]OXM60013.1 hypothetical protein CF165_44780 [Amycolatopsis vastitatis]